MTADSENHRPDSDQTESPRAPKATDSLPLGSRLGTFTLESLICAGGMGAVYRAYDESMKRTVALKVLHPSFAFSPTTQQRFAREAWIAGQLEHPGIVRVYTRGEDRGMQFFAMELADGGSLADYLGQRRSEQQAGADSGQTVRSEQIRWLLERFVELCRALDYVHGHGFVHRDIKPPNILLADADRHFTLSDFGIAHAADMTKVTRAGDFIGTIRYMSPELLTAHRATVDKRTDIYSLGVTLYEAVTLALPFDGDTEERYITGVLAGRAVPARRRNCHIPRDLETVLLTATHHDPDRRYQTALEFAEDLQAVLDRRPIRAKREGLLTRAAKFTRRHAVKLTFVFVLLAVTGLLAWGWFERQKSAWEYRQIGQTLQSILTSGQSAATAAPNWAELAPRLADLIRTSPTDSSVLLYYRTQSMLRNLPIDLGDGKNSFKLNLYAADVPITPQRSDDPVLLVRSIIEIGSDRDNLRPWLVGESAYRQGHENLGFIACLDLDSLFVGKVGQQYLQTRMVCEHYRDALFYELLDHHRHKDLAGTSDSTLVVLGADTLVAAREVNGSAIYWANRPMTTILNLTDHRPASPVLTDTVEKSFDVFIPGPLR